MTHSMTGFASSNIDINLSKTERITLSIHMKSLNSRYFEVTSKLPYLLSNLEVAIHRVLKKTLERGHVYLTIKIQYDAAQPTKVIPALTTIKEYLHAINEIKASCNISEPVHLSTILQLPNILQVEDMVLHSNAEEAVLHAIETVAQQLIKTRMSEGTVLAKDIAKNMKDVQKNLTLVKKASTKAISEKKKDIDQTMQKLQTFLPDDSSVEKMMLEQSKLSLLSELEKIDINEEIVRATSHINNIVEILDNKKIISQGKKLDFTLQELNREVNTIASKCSHSTISSLTIDIKTDIEKAREQAQNIV